ncbi:hypothetical protein AJ79_03825 [Helicocarpus griseus UAMH5409]|uniref:Uncharacterized protein n=1 Tax=Helicocarpus griseus UAMH5409 TaxID=1447875 RepID=A0A2B7XX24_9EURO|nr:hypothetical protein AJ79_03825 [Helicocarpus griseus UAMH5409]
MWIINGRVQLQDDTGKSISSAYKYRLGLSRPVQVSRETEDSIYMQLSGADLLIALCYGTGHGVMGRYHFAIKQRVKVPAIVPKSSAKYLHCILQPTRCSPIYLQVERYVKFRYASKLHRQLSCPLGQAPSLDRALKKTSDALYSIAAQESSVSSIQLIVHLDHGSYVVQKTSDTAEEFEPANHRVAPLFSTRRISAKSSMLPSTEHAVRYAM